MLLLSVSIWEFEVCPDTISSSFSQYGAKSSDACVLLLRFCSHYKKSHGHFWWLQESEKAFKFFLTYNMLNIM